MKKLSNISPFLLLLVPVFVMMLLALTTNNINQNEEVALKSSSVIKSAGIKISTPFYK